MFNLVQACPGMKAGGIGTTSQPPSKVHAILVFSKSQGSLLWPIRNVQVIVDWIPQGGGPCHGIRM